MAVQHFALFGHGTLMTLIFMIPLIKSLPCRPAGVIICLIPALPAGVSYEFHFSLFA